MHCVGSTRKALEAVPGVSAVEVALDSAKVTGDVAPQMLINAVEQAGYQATLA
jgi:Cu+-exporting ATPase